MPRHEADREDLLAEATGLVRRVELQLPGEAEPVVVGERDNGRLSIYFGADPVFHFDDADGLRRAFVDNHLYRTQGTTLARLRRERTESTTTLHRHDLSVTELDGFLAGMRTRLNSLLESLQSDKATILRSVPPEDDLRTELARRLKQILTTTSPLASAIPGKR